MLFQILLVIHIIAGGISIILFWIPAFTKKGGKTHILAGRIYVYAMWIVVLTAAILCIIRIIQGSWEFAVFLGFLALITSKPLWLAIAVLKPRSERFWELKKIFEIVIFIAGLTLTLFGIFFWNGGSSILMIIFGLLGVLSITDLSGSRRKELRHHPVQIHLGEMIISGIAAYTAFLAFGARAFLSSLLSGYWSIIPWILPTVAGIIAIRMIRPHFGRKKAGTSVEG